MAGLNIGGALARQNVGVRVSPTLDGSHNPVIYNATPPVPVAYTPSSSLLDPSLASFTPTSQVVLPPGCADGQGPCISGNLQNYCGSVGASDPVCAGIAGGNAAYDFTTTKPFSCVVDMVKNYMCCGGTLTQEQKSAAYQAFTNVTGFRPFDNVGLLNSEQSQADTIFNANSFYIYVPVMLLIIIIIWIFVGTGRMSWAVGAFFTVLTIIILYGFSVAYRIAVKNSYRKYYELQVNRARAAQNSYENGVAYFLQGIMASACAVTCNGECPTGDCWTCNEPECHPCTECTPTRKCSSCKQTAPKATQAARHA